METLPGTPTEPIDDPRALHTRDMMLNIGPAHPAMHGIVRIVAKLEGEEIEEADVEIGFLGRLLGLFFWGS